MATSGELIKAVATLSGLPETTIATYFRSLREAEPRLVSTGGRGPSAAKMTYIDGASMLTAVMGSRFEREPAEKIVRNFHKMLAVDGARWVTSRQEPRMEGKQDASALQDGRWILEGFELPRLSQLDEGHSFIDALAALLEVAADDGFDGALKHAFPNDRSSCFISVSVKGPRPSASILLSFIIHNGSRYEERVDYQLADEIGITEETYSDIEKQLVAEFGNGDLTLIRRISDRTIFGIANALKTREAAKPDGK